MKAVLHADDAAGELRRCLVGEDGKPFRIAIDRWSERGRIARPDQIWWGRATARTPNGAGWFVDIGLDRPGIIDATKAAITEGAMVSVRIKAEAWADKGPQLSLHALPATITRPDKPGLHALPADDPFLQGCEITVQSDARTARETLDAAIEEAMSPIVPLPGGGDISIEPTRGLTAVDVDTGARTGAGAALEANLLATAELASQISLRSIAGLIVVDFVGMTGAQDRRKVAEALRTHLSAMLGRASEVLELSVFNVCELAVARRARPLAEALGPDPEREALNVLRMIETTGWSAPGARIRARLSPAAAAWLDSPAINWREALVNRIGARWTLEPGLPGQAPQVWSET